MERSRAIAQLDVVIPCHNEEGVVLRTHLELSKILNKLVEKKLIDSYLLIFVDNGSTDHTLKELKQLFQTDSHVNIVSLRNNFGYQGSISAGLFHTSGDVVITIDADLQDPPEKIEEMIFKYQKGFDLVLGVREDRTSDSLAKRLSARIYYRLLKLLKIPIVPHHGDFRLLSRTLVDLFNSLPERNRFIRAMILKLECHYAIVKYARKAREDGYSKFNLKALVSLGFDGITSYSYAPLRIASISGFFFSLISFIGTGFVLYEKIVHNTVIGWASITFPFLFFTGIQLICLGIIGEYIGKIYTETKMRPLFSVREKYSHQTKEINSSFSSKSKNKKTHTHV